LAFVQKNKFFVCVLAATLVLTGMTFGNLQGSPTQTGVQVVNGVVYNFADYPALNHEQLGIFNYLDHLVTDQPYGSWDGYYIGNFYVYLHYFLAFTMYLSSCLFETTPGYRTDYYRQFSWDLLQKMNTSEAVWGNDSVEYMEWTHPGYNFTQYWYPNAENPNASVDVYTGGFRGPANIMWTGHYGLMEALHERNFNTGQAYNELTSFIEQWNTTLTTDGLGHPQAGGIWETGLIPCEPYIVFVNCNSIPMFATNLYDNMYGTNFKHIWDYGLNFDDTVAQDEYGLFTNGYLVQKPLGFKQPTQGAQQPIPGNVIDRVSGDGSPSVSGYINAWALMFLEPIQPNVTIHQYPIYLDVYGRQVSADKFCVVGNYRHPETYTITDMLANIYAMPLANQRGDYVTAQRIRNFLYGDFNKVWSADGRRMWYDATSLIPFVQGPLTAAWLWGTAPKVMRDLFSARPAAFWTYPYISHADDGKIWVYQAQWDPAKSAFILNIGVDQTATLSFSNFDHAPSAYVGGVLYQVLTQAGSDYTLTLAPGSYQVVIR
jgi:hypothetical protein